MASDKWGRQEYPTGWMTSGSIKRGRSSRGSSFSPPSAGISPSIGGPSSMPVDTNHPGFIRKALQGAGRILEQDEKRKHHAAQVAAQQQAAQQKAQQQAQQARQQQRRAGIKYAKAKSRVVKRNAQAQAQQQNTGNNLANAYNAALAQTQQAQVVSAHPFTGAWATSPNNPNAPWNVRPPKGTPARNAPPPPAPLTAPTSGPTPPPIPPSVAPTFPSPGSSAGTPPLPPPSAPDFPGVPDFEPPTRSSTWDAPDISVPAHDYTPASEVPPAPGSRAWYKQQNEIAKQKAKSTPPPPPTNDWPAPTPLEAPPAPPATAPANSRSQRRSATKPKATPAKAKEAPAPAPATPAQQEDKPAKAAKPAKEVKPAKEAKPRATATPKESKPRQQKPKQDKPATPAASSAAPSPTTTPADSGVITETKLIRDPDTGRMVPHKQVNGEWVPQNIGSKRNQ